VKYLLGLLDSSMVLGLPMLLGVVGGLKLYVDGWHFVPYVAVPLVVAIGAVLLGHALMRYRPRLAWVLIELWVLSAIAVTAFATAFLMWVSLDATFGWIGDISVITAENLKTLKTAFATAVSTYVALAWTKDIGDGKGMFWPNTQFKAAMSEAYNSLNPKPAGTSTVYQAIFQDVVAGHGNLGWSFAARGVRAGIFSRWLAMPEPPPQP
jgi:hypothetical protein